jgi:ABC-type tungstate transport system permease subunit
MKQPEREKKEKWVSEGDKTGRDRKERKWWKCRKGEKCTRTCIPTATQHLVHSPTTKSTIAH